MLLFNNVHILHKTYDTERYTNCSFHELSHNEPTCISQFTTVTNRQPTFTHLKHVQTR